MSGAAGKVHIVMAADGAYRKGLEVAKASMVESCSDPSRLVFHEFGEEPSFVERMRRDFGTYKGSPMTFLRLYLGELLPDVEWVVYSDVDTLWRRDVLELASLRDAGKVVQWVRDVPTAVWETLAWCREHGVPPGAIALETYACAGICIINLRLWRERGVLARCLAFAEKHGRPPLADQDLLNCTMEPGEAGMLPPCWDVIVPSPEVLPRCVLHITGVGRCFRAPYEGKIAQYLYWESIGRGTPFKAPWAPPFYVRDWMIRLALPFARLPLRFRIRRNLAWRWFVRRELRSARSERRRGNMV